MTPLPDQKDTVLRDAPVPEPLSSESHMAAAN